MPPATPFVANRARKVSTLYKGSLKKAFVPAGIGLIVLLALGFMPGKLEAHNLQICKASDPAGPVSGAFSFTVVGPSGSPLLIVVLVKFRKKGLGKRAFPVFV